MVHPRFLKRLRAEQPTAIFSEHALQKHVEKARKFVLVAKAFGTALLVSPELLNVTKIDFLTVDGVGEVLRQKQVESDRSLIQIGEFSQTRVPMEWAHSHSAPLDREAVEVVARALDFLCWICVWNLDCTINSKCSEHR
jgi:hypothetical protein